MSIFGDLFSGGLLARLFRRGASPPEVIPPQSPPPEPVKVAALENSEDLSKKLQLDPALQDREEMNSLLSTLDLDAPATPRVASSSLRLRRRPIRAQIPVPAPQESPLRSETRSALSMIHQVPAMASIAGSLVSVLSSNDVDMDEVVDLVSQDPAIAARILRIANSAMVAPSQRIDDIPTAVSLIGLQRVRLTAHALTTLQESRNLVEGFNWKHLWIHSYATALLCGEIPLRLRLTLPENAYLAGLLHDLGKILLSHINPPRYRQLLMEAVCDGTPLAELEMRHFGMTHEEAGAEFARQQRLPEAVIEVMEFHGRPQQAGAHRLVVASVSAANYLAKTHGLGFSGSPLVTMEETLGDTAAWKILAHAKGPRAPLPLDFHLQLRPFIADLKIELHSWLTGH